MYKPHKNPSTKPRKPRTPKKDKPDRNEYLREKNKARTQAAGKEYKPRGPLSKPRAPRNSLKIKKEHYHRDYYRENENYREKIILAIHYRFRGQFAARECGCHGEQRLLCQSLREILQPHLPYNEG